MCLLKGQELWGTQEERMAYTLSHAGPSIVIASLTDIMVTKRNQSNLNKESTEHHNKS